MSVDVELDAKGLRCPMPIMKATKAIKEMKPGQTLRVQATDPGSKRDFEGWARNGGHTLLSVEEGNGVYTYTIRKG
jgi:tRNA 2-thiouridine synthesizing protein A